MAAAEDFADYEALLRRAGVRRSPNGSLMFEPAPETASLVDETSLADGSITDRSLESAAAAALEPDERSRRRAAYVPTDLDELNAVLCEGDLELIAGEVDFHANAVKKAVAEHLLALKGKLAESVKALEAERRFIVARSLMLQNQADTLKEALFSERVRTGTVRNYALSLVFWWRGERDAKDAFQRWRALAMEKRRQRASIEAAQKHYARRLVREVLRSWRTNAHADYRERVHTELDARWADAAQAEASKFALVISRLEEELAETRAALERETIARNDVEERFKQAFMRGVCALNFEALSVMGLKAGAGGTAASARASPMPMPVRL